MRVLFLSHRVPYPPDKGEKTRAFHQLRGLAAQHEVDLFTLADDPADLEHRQALAQYCRSITMVGIDPLRARAKALPYLLTRTPLTLPCFYSSKLQAGVDRALAQGAYDRVFVYCSAMAQYLYGSRLGARRRHQVPVILDIVDVDSNKWEQYANRTRFPLSTVYRRESRRLRHYEREVCEASDCVLVSTEREAALARTIAPAAHVRVVHIGVDTEYFVAGPVPSTRTIVFTGEMSYLPNADAAVFFAREVLPIVRRSLPDARFLVVGRHPTAAVQQLSQLPGVTVTGAVADVRPYLQEAAVAVAPLRIAAGVQTKILEALASARPVVATSRAVQGLTPGVAGMVRTADTAVGLAEHVVAVLSDFRAAARWGQQSRERVAAEYSWESAHRLLLDVLQDPCPTDTEVTHAPVRRLADVH